MTHQQSLFFKLLLVITGIALIWWVLCKLTFLLLAPVIEAGGLLGFLGKLCAVVNVFGTSYVASEAMFAAKGAYDRAKSAPDRAKSVN